MSPLAWIAIIGLAAVAVAAGLWQFRVAALMCTDEFEEGERRRRRFESQTGECRRLREEDATPW